jgi:2,4-dienoyl-CoA reductase (NADPH2)
VAELITHVGKSSALDIDKFAKEWGIDFENHPRGGVTGVEPVIEESPREVWLLQRKNTAVGKGLGKTTGLDPPPDAEPERRENDPGRYL